MESGHQAGVFLFKLGELRVVKETKMSCKAEDNQPLQVKANAWATRTPHVFHTLVGG